MNKIKSYDIDYGLNQELLTQEIIEDYFCNKLIKSENKYEWFDFKDLNNNLYEIKSRKFNINKYDSTMISEYKVNNAYKIKNSKVYFIFNFIDCIGYIEYNKELFQTFRYDYGGRYDRGKNEISKYYYIPINKLIII